MCKTRNKLVPGERSNILVTVFVTGTVRGGEQTEAVATAYIGAQLVWEDMALTQFSEIFPNEPF